jgi:hypothetical protein
VINFRYHVVSITAVFLALAVGLVLGTAALNGPVTEGLFNETQSLRKSNGQLRDQVAELEDEVAKGDEFIKEVAPLLVGGRLTGRRVLLVAMPGADDGAVGGVIENLRLAQASLTGTVRLTDTFVAPENREDVRDLATRLLPPNIDDVPSDADGVTASAALLAGVLLEHQPAVTGSERTAVLTGYQQQGLIDMDKKITQPAQGVIIVTDLPATDDADAAGRNAAVLAATRQFARVGPVVAGRGTGGDSNPVAAIRSDPVRRRSVSTVDNVNGSLGQLAAVLALVHWFTEGKAGHYGISDGADGRIPKPGA